MKSFENPFLSFVVFSSCFGHSQRTETGGFGIGRPDIGWHISLRQALTRLGGQPDAQSLSVGRDMRQLGLISTQHAVFNHSAVFFDASRVLVEFLAGF